jgi:hypothetical protein
MRCNGIIIIIIIIIVMNVSLTLTLRDIQVCRMASSEILRRVALLRTDVSEELSASLIRVTRIDELGTTLAVTINRRIQGASVARWVSVLTSPILVTLIKEALSSS